MHIRLTVVFRPVQQSSLRFLFALLFALFTLQVRFNVKVGEQDHEGKRVANHDPFCPSGVFTVVVQYGTHPRQNDHCKLSLKTKAKKQTNYHNTQNLTSISECPVAKGSFATTRTLATFNHFQFFFPM